jgi:hypothetical protein
MIYRYGLNICEMENIYDNRNTYDGKITCKPLAESLGLRYENPEILIKLEK